MISPCGATYFARVGSSVQTAYPSPRPGGQVSLISLYLLSKLNPLRWASVWYRLRAGELFRLWASSFCSGAKGTKRPPGAAHGHLQCPIPPPPDPHYFTGEPSRGSEGTQPAREKPRMGVCAPTAAAKKRLNNHLLLQGASRLTFCLRGRAHAGRPFTGTCTVLAKTRRKSHRVPVPHLAAGFVTCSASFPLDLAGHRQPPGGTSNRGTAAGTQWKPSVAGSIGRGRATE